MIASGGVVLSCSVVYERERCFNWFVARFEPVKQEKARGNDCPLKYTSVKLMLPQGQVRSSLFMEDCETEKFRSSTTFFSG